MISIDVNKKYFLISFKFNKSTPEDFGLIQSNKDSSIYIDRVDNSQWIKHESYGFGWGNENGYLRLPKLKFDELWYLLINSTIQENKYGSAYIIEQEYPDELLKVLVNIFTQQHDCIDEKMQEGFKILKLHEPKNRSTIIGKSFEQIYEDSENWKEVSEKVKKLSIKS